MAHVRRLLTPASVTLVALLAACVPVLQPVPELEPERGAAPAQPIPRAPPPVTVQTANGDVFLEASSYCFGNGCVDGIPPRNPPDVGDLEQVAFGFPLPGWTFEATFAPVGQACPRRHTVPVEQTDEGVYVVEPAGPADTYDVSLFGRGDGDLFVTFRWTTPRDGVMPVPSGRLAVLANHDGAVDSYGVELELSDLAETPEVATADITVTAANGRSLTFTASRAPGCLAQGTVYWDGPDDAGLAAAALGPAPFTYDVVVTIGEVEHRATATWPDDEIEDFAPSVPLEFVPPLPALR